MSKFLPFPIKIHQIGVKTSSFVESEGKLIVSTKNGEELIMEGTLDELINQLTSKRFGKIVVNTQKNAIESTKKTNFFFRNIFEKKKN